MTSTSVVGYLRISDDDGAGWGVASQREECEEHAERHGLTITKTFVDNDRSAFSDKPREDYCRMLAHLEHGDVGAVLVWHPDRLHRSPGELESFLKVARRHKILVKTAQAGDFDPATAYGRKALRSATVEAGYESEHRSERVALARKRQARQGVYGGGGKRPYGWGMPTNRVRRKLVDPATREYADVPVLDMHQHVPEEAEEIRGWADDLLSGVSMRQVLRSLHERDVLNSSGVCHWTSPVVRAVLTAPRVSGHAVHKGRIVRRDAWEAIIPEDTRQALCALFADPSRRTTAGSPAKWLGSGIFECGWCGDGTTMYVRNRRGVPAYTCEEAGHCARNAEQLDSYVAAVITARLSQPDAVELMPHGEHVDFTALRARTVTLQSRKQEAAQSFAQGHIDAAQLATITADLDDQLEQVSTVLTTAAETSPLAALAGSAQIRSAWDDLSLGRKRQIVRLLLEVVVVLRQPRQLGMDALPEFLRLRWRE